MEYDEQFLVKAADRFEKKARQIVVSAAVRYTLIAAIFSFAGAGIMQSLAKTDIPIGLIVLVASIFGLAAGITAGREKAFEFHVEAHKLLALVEIHAHVAPSIASDAHVTPESPASV